MKRYILQAESKNGGLAPEFLSRCFDTKKEAINTFDNLYSRKGFKIKIYTVGKEGWVIASQTIKSTYR